MGEGDRFMAVSRMLPDLSFTGSSASSPSVDITVKTRNYPGGDFIDTSTDAVSRSSTSSTVPAIPDVNVETYNMSSIWAESFMFCVKYILSGIIIFFN